MVLHDLNLAARYSDHMVAMCDGEVVAEGTPREVLVPPLLRSTFRLEARVVDDPVTGRPLVVPVSPLPSDPAEEPARTPATTSTAP
jgi:iron complex transport system ATP-binding protein